MKNLLMILVLSLKDLLRPKVLAILVIPFFASFVLWGLLTWLLWDWIIGLGTSLYHFDLMQRLVEMLSPYLTLTENPLVAVTAAAFILVVVIPAMLITALLITSVLIVPVIVRELRAADFPQILKKSNSIFAGTGTSLAYSIKYFASWVGSLPLWIFIPGGAVLIPYLLISWFNSRLFTWEVLTEVLAPGDIKMFVDTHSRTLFILGLITSVFYYLPIVNLVAPVITSAAFARFCLSEIAKKSQVSKTPG